MQMIGAWLESILPGARSLRPPLIAGLLWTILLWISLSERIPAPSEAGGWIEQAYALAAAAGTVPVAMVSIVIIWVIGVMSLTFTMPLATVIGSALQFAKRYFAWQRHARKTVRELRRELEQLEQRREALRSQSEATALSQESRVDRRAADIRTKLSAATLASRWSLITVRNESSVAALGEPPTDRAAEVAEYLVKSVAREAFDEAIQKEQRALIDASFEDWDLYEIGRALLREFDPDPMDALRGLDERLYLDLDRERSEREVRLAVAPPLIALGAAGSVWWSMWFVVVVFIATGLFLRGSLVQSAERPRIMKLVGMKGLRTPALREAAVKGRDSFRRQLLASETK